MGMCSREASVGGRTRNLVGKCPVFLHFWYTFRPEEKHFTILGMVFENRVVYLSVILILLMNDGNVQGK